MSIKIKYGVKNLESHLGIMTFGRMLKNFREIQECSQKEFANRLGISPQRLNDFEKERRLPDISSAIIFARKLQESESFFVQMLFQDYLRLEKLNFQVKIIKRAS
jgi:transcriptional regulator with XRE-family HTH domain